jgi:hypothetical protein
MDVHDVIRDNNISDWHVGHKYYTIIFINDYSSNIAADISSSPGNMTSSDIYKILYPDFNNSKCP